MYDQGRGVPRDSAQALVWFRKAADQGNAKAQFNLGVVYEDGQGVPRDYVLALMWVNLAVSHVDAENRGVTMQSRDALTAKMTPAQIAEAERMASEWKPK